MRCLITTDRLFLDLPGGAYLVAWETARLLRSAGVNVTILCGCAPPTRPGVDTIEGIRVLRYGTRPRRSADPRRWFDRMRDAREACRAVLGKETFDLLHGHAVPETEAALDACAIRRHVQTVHSPIALEQEINWASRGVSGALKTAFGLPILRASERRVLRHADAIHTLSRFTRDCLVQQHGEWIRERTAIVPWWADPHRSRAHSKASARAKLGWGARGPLLFTLRRLVTRMGIADLLLALKQVAPDHEFSLYVGGEGPELENLRRLATGPLEGRVTFTGRLTEDQKHLAYQAADLFIVPSRSLECFGLIVLEAMQYGCPTLVSSAGALPEVLEGAVPWLSFPAGDVAALARILRDALSGTRALPPEAEVVAFVRSRFEYARVAPRYLGLLTQGYR